MNPRPLTPPPPPQPSLLSYALRVTQRLIINRTFRHKVLRLLVRLAEATPTPDWVEVTQCLMFLDDAPRVADILARLIDGSEDDALVAYQVGRAGGGGRQARGGGALLELAGLG
jgi:26S proteasome regulatory subunit N2